MWPARSNVDMVSTHACIWTDGVLQDLGTLAGGSSSVATGINKARMVTGWSRVAGAGNHAFIYQDGTMTDLGTFGGFRSYGMAINRAGHVAGAADRSDRSFRAFLHDGVTMHDLGTLTDPGWSWANALNDAGEVVGRAGPGDVPFGPYRATLFSNGQVIDLGTLGGNHSEALAINNAGHIVGWSTSSGTNVGAQSTKAFLYRNGQMISLVHRLDPVSGAGWKLRMATGINDAGQIVGWGERDGVPRYFILTPMP
jgi:probable HAF family extracellular repeat protein